MSPEEIWAAQSPIHGWEQETRAFRPTAGVDSAPRWADFADPLDAISQRARRAKEAMRPTAWADGRIVSPEEKRALDTLGLGTDADRRELRPRGQAATGGRSLSDAAQTAEFRLAFSQRGKLIRAGAPTGGETHRLMLLHRLGGPVAGAGGIACALALGLNLPDADHEGTGRFQIAIDRIGGDKTTPFLPGQIDAAQGHHLPIGTE
ncbi:hypothetical protein E4T56_gene19852, partial [Termitomyces sp. T112]